MLRLIKYTINAECWEREREKRKEKKREEKKNKSTFCQVVPTCFTAPLLITCEWLQTRRVATRDAREIGATQRCTAGNASMLAAAPWSYWNVRAKLYLVCEVIINAAVREAFTVDRTNASGWPKPKLLIPTMHSIGTSVNGGGGERCTFLLNHRRVHQGTWFTLACHSLSV